ncbi:cytochrome P450 2D11-like [Asterias rubens]|uniref:cytochrome P450 2D11-like n=1 Tax=Asterias rubens TaxID=7604 RepID=UPI00145555C6|nr:cytochrome P450 2D11-like [Asterias rubens]
MGNHQPGKNGSPPDPQTVPFLVDFGTGDEFLNKWVELAHKYGSVFSVKMEGRWVVFVTGWEAAREVLVKTELDFADKPRYPSSEVHNLEYKGIFDAPCGDRWKNQRSFALTTLRSFGFGKVSLEGSITKQVGTCQEFKAVDCRDLLGAHTANVLFALIFGLR